MQKLYSIEDIRQKHEQKAHGSFFDWSFTHFLDLRALKTVYQGPGGIYFVTSARSYRAMSLRRFYTVWKFDSETGRISTTQEYERVDRRNDAVVMARNAAKER
jgi:hypothetical protein